MTNQAEAGKWETSVEKEIGDVSVGRPHVLLLGAGASKAALPDGDKNGRSVPVLRDVAEDLDLFDYFPEELRDLARSDFEAAYSRLADMHDCAEDIQTINDQVGAYFAELELPDEPNLYDVLNLTLREKDAIFTFNWDPFLVQSRIRLARLGVRDMPKLFFLHGNVRIGYCVNDTNSGLLGRPCSMCGEPFEPSTLLFPVERKNYQDGHLSQREWEVMHEYLGNCFMFTVFGYSAPDTDVEAVELMTEAWGQVEQRRLEQTEVINRPGADHKALRETWDPFIHTHHYEIHESFYDSWIANHPRRTGEAYRNQFLDAKFIHNNAVPRDFDDLESLVAWFRALFDAEQNDGEEAEA